MAVNTQYIIDNIKVTKELLGKYYIIVNKYYGGDTTGYLKIIFDFNGISDPVTIKLGKLLFLPTRDYIEYQKEINAVDDIIDTDEVPGINKIGDILAESTISEDDKTIAMPKLRIELESIKYDTETGKIIF